MTELDASEAIPTARIGDAEPPLADRSADFPLFIEGEDPTFRQHVSTAHSIMVQMAQESGCPPVKVTAVLAEDFVPRLQEALKRAGKDWGAPITTERVGGTLAAKNIAVSEDDSEIEIYFNAGTWRGAEDNPFVDAQRIALAVHEFMHPLFGGLRRASGALAGVQFPSFLPREVARSIVRVAIEELRCDTIVDLILQNAGNVVMPDGEQKPLRLAMIQDLGYCHSVLNALEEKVYPFLPDAVESYQQRRISLEDMWGRVCTVTDQMMTLLAHAQAEATSVDYPGPLAGDAEDMLGAALYFRPAWNRIVEAFNRQPLIPSVDRFAELERELLDEGEGAIYELWRTLGITVEEQPDRQFALWVDSPMRRLGQGA